MLIRFAVENFLSFKELTEFNMTAGKMTRHKDHIAVCNGKRILKGAYVFGANAGGKSNLIRAIAFAKSIIEDGLENTNCDKKYFRIDNSCKQKPSVFQFDIYSNGHFYSYGFAVSLISQRIEEEWLYQIDDGDKCIFLRSREQSSSACELYTEIKFSTERQKERFYFYADYICNSKMDHTLFLSDVYLRSPDDEQEYLPFRDVFDWFNRLTIIFPESTFDSIERLMDDQSERTRLENLLRYFDTGITEVHKKAITFDKAFNNLPEPLLESIKSDMAKKLKGDATRAKVMGDISRFEVKLTDGELMAFRVVSDHGNSEDLFEYSDESDGTQRLFDLIPIYQRVLHNNVIIIDELDRSLHTKAVQEFINYFYSIAQNLNSQLIVTTHDSNIMDLDFIRQDEIWFIERQADHSSKLYSLNQFRERFDKRIEKEYLMGRYGAIPVFRQIALEEGDYDDTTCQ